MTTLLVVGHGRCGTSCVMQMLDAGGYPCVGSYPGYEVVESDGKNLAETIADFRDRAVKLVNPTAYRDNLEELLKLPGVAAIVMSRSPREQAKSQIKFLTAMGAIPRGKYDYSKMAESCQRDQAVLDGITAGVPRLRLSFEQLVSQPRAAALAMGKLAGPLVEVERADGKLEVVRFDADRAARQVEKRIAGCYPGMLEVALVQRTLRP